jgi:conjugal transfer pilus assembly protein TraE
MKISLLGRDAANRLGAKQWVVSLLAMTLLLNLLLAAAMLMKGDHQREILVPPVIHQTFWVEDDKVSKEYLVEMGVFLAQLYFDVTPTNVDFNHKTLLFYTHPKFYGALQVKAGGYADRMKTDNSSTFLAISGMHVDEAGSRVAVTGLLNTYVGDQRISSVPKVYAFTFSFNSGRVLLTSIKETNEKDPFGTGSGE